MATVLNSAKKLNFQTLMFIITKRNVFNYTSCKTHFNRKLKRRSPCITIPQRSASVKLPAELVQESLSEQNKKRVIERLDAAKSINVSRPTEAAVLVPFCMVNNKPSLLFTLRSTSLVSHRGQVSFPGGKRDKEDKSLVDTAVRETVEELGIPENIIDVWGALQSMPDRSGKFAVTPVVSFLGDVDVKSIPFNHDEVSEVFHLTLEHIFEHRRYTKFTDNTTWPVFVNGPHRVWGMTALIMDFLFEIMFPGDYKKVTSSTIYNKLFRG